VIERTTSFKRSSFALEMFVEGLLLIPRSDAISSRSLWQSVVEEAFSSLLHDPFTLFALSHGIHLFGILKKRYQYFEFPYGPKKTPFKAEGRYTSVGT